MTHHVEDSKFALHNRKEIVFILEDMVKHRTPINLDAAEGMSLVTSVLGVNAESNRVYMDVSSDAYINEQIADSQHVNFATQTGVKVRWHSTHLQWVALQDGEAFSMLIPSVVERIQRREYFRLSTPQGAQALICKIPTETEVIEIPLFDMSVGGIGVSIKGALPEVFMQGAILEGCSVEFPVIGIVPMSLRVCGIWSSIKTKSGEQMHRVGLEFVELSRGAANVIQRYMIQLEAERISLT